MVLHDKFENFDPVENGTERAFGLVIAGVCLVVGLWPIITGGSLGFWWIVAAGILTLTALLIPRVLYPLNQIWFKLGLLLQKIVTPIIMVGLYFLILCPLGLALRLFGKKFFLKTHDPQARTYWKERIPNKSTAQSMKNPY